MLTNKELLKKITVMSKEMANLARDLEKKKTELEKVHSKIKALSGILPICMHCKKIRDSEGTWKQIEEYITERSEAQFSHGICEDCLKKYFPDFDCKS